MKKIIGNMKLLFTFILPFLYILTCSAQLSKFEGVWTNESVLYYGDQVIPLHKIFKITTENGVFIRLKESHKNSDGSEKKLYYKIKDIAVKGDSMIICKVFFPEEMTSKYADPAKRSQDTPNTHSSFDYYKEYEIYEMSIQGGALIVTVPSLIQEYFLDDNLVDTKTIKRGYEFECYNEKDNW